VKDAKLLAKSQSEWNELQQQLVTELAVGMTRRLFEIFNDYRRFWHFDGSTAAPPADSDASVSMACNTLWLLGVAHGLHSEAENYVVVDPVWRKRGYPWRYRLWTETEIRQTLASAERPLFAPEVDEIIERYLDIACGGTPPPPELQVWQTPITPPEVYHRELIALSKLGYIERNVDGFLWTSKVTSIMQAAQLWDKNGKVYSALLPP
jgi:hypothetical protein